MTAPRIAAVTAAGVAVVACAQLVITSLDKNGDLTWTNSVSNATYRVEWASSVAGPWQSFDALTNLSLLSATSPAVTVKVPMLYRVVWLDAPAHAGTWNFSGFDSAGSLVATGRLTLSAQTNPITGTWDMRPVTPTSFVWRVENSGELKGEVSGSALYLDLTPDCCEGCFNLYGTLSGDSYSGAWTYTGFASTVEGTFAAQRQIGADRVRLNQLGKKQE